LQRRVPGVAKQYILKWMIDEIREKISAGQFEFSKHAVDQSILRHVTLQEIHEAIAGGEIVEDYPDDKYGPSCLVLGSYSIR
jgi:hypothetical protein